MVKIELGIYKCSRCGNKYEDSLRSTKNSYSDRMCRKCTIIVAALAQLKEKEEAKKAAIKKMMKKS